MRSPRRFDLGIHGYKTWSLTAVLWVALTAPARGEGLLRRVLDFLGVTASSGQLKSSPAAASGGAVVMIDLTTGKERKLTSTAGYHWPVFSADGKSVYALDSGSSLVSFTLASGKVNQGPSLPNVRALVGCNTRRPREILVLLTDPSQPIGVLDLSTQKVTTLAYDPKSDEEVRLLVRLEREERINGKRRVRLCEQTRADIAGTRTWTAVCLQDDGTEPRVLGSCTSRTCRQPSLSPDGQWVVFVQDKR